MSKFQNDNQILTRVRLLQEVVDDFFFDQQRIDLEENPTTLEENLGKESPIGQNLRRQKLKLFYKLQKEITKEIDDYLESLKLDKND